MTGPRLDLRRSRAERITNPAVLPLLRVGVVLAALSWPAWAATTTLHPFGDDETGCRAADGIPCPGVVTSLAPQHARDLLAALLVYAVVLAVAIGWALARHRHHGTDPIRNAAEIMLGTVGLALAVPLAWTSLPFLDGGESWAWSVIWLAAPVVIATHRTLGGRSWPALLSVLPTAWPAPLDGWLAWFPAALWLVTAAVVAARAWRSPTRGRQA